MLDAEWVRTCCLSLPHTSEKVQWGSDLVFKIGEKMYAVTALEPAGHWLSFKCTDEDFAELVERPGIVPAPYLARAHWVALQNKEAMSGGELQEFLRRAYDQVLAKLPKKTRDGLTSPEAGTKGRARVRGAAAGTPVRRKGSKGRSA
jgi:predicted DNA-binding protein (MmcQ/YjbR family)